MKNKILLSILAAFGLAGASSQAQTTTFVDVATLGDGVSVISSAGAVKVNATVLTKNQRWTRDRVYILANNVIVPNGITLTIEPGTLVRAEIHSRAQGTGTEAALTPADPGALVVARGGKLIAAGTADAPIIFTSIDDPNVPGGVATIPPIVNKGVVAGTGIANAEKDLKTGYTTVSGVAGVGQYSISGGSLTANAKNYSKTWTASGESAFQHDGLWGGIVLCGNSTVVRGYSSGVNARSTNISEPIISTVDGSISGTYAGVQLVEGMAGFSAYSFGGGDAETDDSGILRFISNRYGGYVIASNAELNSFSFYGVGRGTVLEFIEAWNNADDDFEFWGGDVNLRYALSLFCGDDGLDTDQGYLGVIQYFVQLQNNAIGTDGTSVTGRRAGNYGDNLTENDGPESNNSAVPYTVYTLANATLIGRGYATQDSTTGGWGNAGVYNGPNFKDNASAQFFNSLIMDNPNGAVCVTDSGAIGSTTYSNGGGSAINRFSQARSSGGFDGAGRADDLTTSSTGAPSTPDGLFNNVWWYRNGLAASTASGHTGGKYASFSAFKTAYEANAANWETATDSQLFPKSGYSAASTSRGFASGGSRQNEGLVVANIKAGASYNELNRNPGVTVNPFHRLSMDLRISDSTARALPNSALPNRRGLNTDATFIGAVRDNVWMKGWTLSDSLNIYSGSAIVPEVAVSANGSSQPVITFGGEAGVKYVVEVSTDNKTYTKVQTVSASAGNNTVTDTARTVGSTPLFYRVIAL